MVKDVFGIVSFYSCILVELTDVRCNVKKKTSWLGIDAYRTAR